MRSKRSRGRARAKPVPRASPLFPNPRPPPPHRRTDRLRKALAPPKPAKKRSFLKKVHDVKGKCFAIVRCTSSDVNIDTEEKISEGKNMGNKFASAHHHILRRTWLVTDKPRFFVRYETSVWAGRNELPTERNTKRTTPRRAAP